MEGPSYAHHSKPNNNLLSMQYTHMHTHACAHWEAKERKDSAMQKEENKELRTKEE